MSDKPTTTSDNTYVPTPEDAEQLNRTIDIIGETIGAALTIAPTKKATKEEPKGVPANLLPAEQAEADTEPDSDEIPEDMMPADVPETDPTRPFVDYIFTDAILKEIPAYNELVSFLTSLAPKLFSFGERISKSKSSRRGRKLEDAIKEYITHSIWTEMFHLYHQVRYNGRFLDFIITKEDISKLEQRTGISDETLSRCVFLSVKTAVKNDWSADWEPANKARGYILYTYGKDMGQGRTYPNADSWNTHIKNPNSMIIVHCSDHIREEDSNFVQTDEGHNLKGMILDMLGEL